MTRPSTTVGRRLDPTVYYGRLIGMETPTVTGPTIHAGEVRRRISYDLRVVGFLGSEVVILEGVDDGRRTTVRADEVATWPVVTSVCPDCGGSCADWLGFFERTFGGVR